MKIGLVLGAGGVQGGAWLTGALDALAEETGWDPATADVVVGTSAGSVIASLCVAGIPPWFMVAHSAGETFEGVVDARGRPAAEADRSGGARFGFAPGLPKLGPGSWSLGLRTLVNPRRYTPAAVFSGWAPRGIISTEPLKEIIRSVVPEGWSDHPAHWVVACDYGTGRRVAFGREDAPVAGLADAVAASCAIPGFYRPVRIAERDYVDGGIYSASNLDIVRDRELDLVICLNPTSSLHPVRALDPREWPTLAFRRAAGRRLGSEAKKLAGAGTHVALIQPVREDLEVISRNLMSSRNRNRVIATARETVAEQLASPALAELVADLPPGEPVRVRRPTGSRTNWPDLNDLRAAAGRRFASA